MASQTYLGTDGNSRRLDLDLFSIGMVSHLVWSYLDADSRKHLYRVSKQMQNSVLALVESVKVSIPPFLSGEDIQANPSMYVPPSTILQHLRRLYLVRTLGDGRTRSRRSDQPLEAMILSHMAGACEDGTLSGLTELKMEGTMSDPGSWIWDKMIRFTVEVSTSVHWDRLTSLELKNCKVDFASLQGLFQPDALPLMETLKVRRCFFTDEGVDLLHTLLGALHWPRLQTLECDNLGDLLYCLGRKEVQALASQAPRLTSLILPQVVIHEGGVENLTSMMPQLVHVDVDRLVPLSGKSSTSCHWRSLTLQTSQFDVLDDDPELMGGDLVERYCEVHHWVHSYRGLMLPQLTDLKLLWAYPGFLLSASYEKPQPPLAPNDIYRLVVAAPNLSSLVIQEGIVQGGGVELLVEHLVHLTRLEVHDLQPRPGVSSCPCPWRELVLGTGRHLSDVLQYVQPKQLRSLRVEPPIVDDLPPLPALLRRVEIEQLAACSPHLEVLERLDASVKDGGVEALMEKLPALKKLAARSLVPTSNLSHLLCPWEDLQLTSPLDDLDVQQGFVWLPLRGLSGPLCKEVSWPLEGPPLDPSLLHSAVQKLLQLSVPPRTVSVYAVDDPHDGNVYPSSARDEVWPLEDLGPMRVTDTELLRPLIGRIDEVHLHAFFVDDVAQLSRTLGEHVRSLMVVGMAQFRFLMDHPRSFPNLEHLRAVSKEALLTDGDPVMMVTHRPKLSCVKLHLTAAAYDHDNSKAQSWLSAIKARRWITFSVLRSHVLGAYIWQPAE